MISVSTISRSVAAAFALAIACAVCASIPAVSPAAQTTVSLCSNVNDWTDANGDSLDDGWFLDVSCSGVQVHTTSISTVTGASWTFPRDLGHNLEFERITFDLAGGDGSDGNRSQGLQFCNASQVCTQRISPEGANVWPARSYDLSIADGELPPGTSQMRVHGSCNPIGPCLPGAPLVVTNIKFHMQDDVAPVLTFDDGSTWEPTNEPRPDPIVLDDWNGAVTKRIQFLAADDQAGLLRTEFAIGAGKFPHDANCGTVGGDMTRLCPALAFFTQDVDFATKWKVLGLKAGTNSFTVTAEDGAGNLSAPFVGQFKLDVEPPLISGFRATSVTGAGWQPASYVDLAWTNAGESQATDTQSGVAALRYKVSTAPGSAIFRPTARVDEPGIDSVSGVRLGAPGIWRIVAWTVDGAGNRSETREIQVGVDPTVPAAPAIHDRPPVNSQELEAGPRIEWTPPTASISGICGYAMVVDEFADSDPGTAVDVEAGASSASLGSTARDGSGFVHLRAISCAGVPGQVAHKRVEYDLSAPEIRFSDPGSDGWYDPANPMIVDIAGSSAGDDLAISVDGSPEALQQGTTASVSPSDGVHTVLARASDAAGNESVRQAVVKFDGSGPLAAFALRDSAHPTRVRAVVTDELSGVDFAYMQYRQVGQTDWRLLGDPVYPSPAGRAGVELDGRIPDGLLPEGLYELRVVARDVNGQQTIARTYIDGSPAVLRLPLRRSPTIATDFSIRVFKRECVIRSGKRRCKRKSQVHSSRSLTVNYGRPARLSGRIADADGDALPGVQLDVTETVVGSPARHVGQLTSDSLGRFEFSAKPGPSRRIAFEYAGSEVDASATTSSRLRVRGKVTLRVSKRRLNGPGDVTFGGRVYAAGARIPTSGMSVVLQVRRSGGWQDLRAVSTNGDGQFTTRLRLPAAEQPVVWTVRAVVPWVEGWPYETGTSTSRSIVVVP
ncbi:MAG: carboxypeptidase regulatory-like domain-containing protein [Actinobacteria bacterium]|nr:carboxypeptidase regulatory-like domain-containing protein [Actinomycetota bacterium]